MYARAALGVVLVSAALGCGSEGSSRGDVREAGVAPGVGPAADGGEGDFRPPPLRTPPAAPEAGSRAPQDAGFDAARPDLTPNTAEEIDAAAMFVDGGDAALPDLEEDAGTVPNECATRACLCESICGRGVALSCQLEGPLEVCVMTCTMPLAACEAEAMDVLRCKAARGDAYYVCDPNVLAFVVLGCEAEEATVGRCMSRR
jgi:hypothetical protein